MAAYREGLKRRREQLGLTQEAAALALGVASSTFRAWEYGTSTPRVGMRRRIMRVFQTSLVEVDQWFNKRSAAPDGLEVPDWLGHFATLEQGASRLWSFETIAVPGLLQTAAYAAAVVSIRPEAVAEADVARNVQARLARQAVLTRHPDPLHLSVIIDESVLHREAGGPDILAAQLHHLVDAAAAPNVDLRVLPLTSGTFPFGSFTVLASAGSPEPYMACVQDHGGMHYLERDRGLEAHIELFNHLQEVALSPSDSVDLIAVAAKELDQ